MKNIEDSWFLSVYCLLVPLVSASYPMQLQHTAVSSVGRFEVVGDVVCNPMRIVTVVGDSIYHLP